MCLSDGQGTWYLSSEASDHMTPFDSDLVSKSFDNGPTEIIALNGTISL